MKLFKIGYKRTLRRIELVAAESESEARQKAVGIPEAPDSQFWLEWNENGADIAVDSVELIARESDIPEEWEDAIPWGLPDSDRRYCIDLVELDGTK